MTNQLDVYIKRLPPFIGKFIFSFLIPDTKSIEFGDYRKTMRDNYGYSLRYEVAFYDNSLLENFMGMYLSQIKKKNGKHRYYLTKEYETHCCQGCGMDGCRSNYCRGGWEYEKTYDSKYVGKDLENALCALFLNVDLRKKITAFETSLTKDIRNGEMGVVPFCANLSDAEPQDDKSICLKQEQVQYCGNDKIIQDVYDNEW